MQYKILAVDDEEPIRRLLKDFFNMQGYLVYTAADGREAIELLEKGPDLILLDINMPDMDGFEVCRKIRNHVNCPIIFLTAKVEERDRVNGLMIGGDDYVVKPFSMEELSARVKAHLRREERSGSKEKLKFSDELVINYTERTVFYQDKEIPLTRMEFDIVELLSMHRGQIFSKEKIYETLRGFEEEGDSSTIAEHVRRIRLKIGKFSDKVYVDTVWGVGYKWIG
ncbi:response regulator transcription factor [Murimonas intestini]|uniref:Stage 0 sporulation protein A homolog n=1 Tax=Murimonas intestini TaxID=1337051 RepID=A0AB73T1P2_9FIRM|nr:response regulator transcription factor [Murimonas intestini]MCR1842495.1 response regulator transcription factor [Murimonas intestini]MCR1867147.1 response regulator transcription factor [Murimonas intestini]MCR1884333.1 response regulator transcription factor [Murimonas intestini]